VLNAQQIMEIIPHRYPMLLVDRVLEIEPGVRAVGIKCVSSADPYFVGHYPGNPIMPGVLIMEACAQVGAVALLSVEANRSKVPMFAGLDGVRFRKPVVPGDVLRMEVQITKQRGPIGKGEAKAYVGDELVAEGELTFALGDR
jgi:3-hydroxyacyl-[acyl-carrier-protein] dehydratase